MRRTRNDLRAFKGLIQSKKLHDLETAEIYELMDDVEMNQHLADPEKATPRPRSDLPKNHHHDPIE